MEYLELVYITTLTIIGARAIHAALINRKYFIPRSKKLYAAPLAFATLAIGLGISGDSEWAYISAGFLFMGLRWMSDYLLNILRGLDFHYHPEPSDTKYLAFTDEVLSEGSPKVRLAIRILALVLCALISYLIFINHA